jgi:hypothetical protein
LRLLEQERARLHAIEEAQARHEESLEKERARLGADREEALAWNERVAAVGDKGFFERPKPQDAERLHRRIGGVLDVMHDRLSRVLQSLIVGPERGVPLGERLDEELLHEEHRGQLDALWSSVAHKDEALRAMESRLLWERASELRDAIVALNRARLQALGLSGRAYRSEVTGFGPRGVQEARRELQQVALELRYHVLELPRHLRHLQDDLSRSPFALVWSAIHLLIVLALFRMWRQHADRALTRMRRAAREGVAQTATTRLLASSAWYLRRIHRPLDWLVLLWIVLGMAGELAALPEVVRSAGADLGAGWFAGGAAAGRGGGPSESALAAHRGARGPAPALIAPAGVDRGGARPAAQPHRGELGAGHDLRVDLGTVLRAGRAPVAVAGLLVAQHHLRAAAGTRRRRPLRARAGGAQ